MKIRKFSQKFRPAKFCTNNLYRKPTFSKGFEGVHNTRWFGKFLLCALLLSDTVRIRSFAFQLHISQQHAMTQTRTLRVPVRVPSVRELVDEPELADVAMFVTDVNITCTPYTTLYVTTL